MTLKRLSPFRCPQCDGPVLTPGQRGQPVVTIGPMPGQVSPPRHSDPSDCAAYERLLVVVLKHAQTARAPLDVKYAPLWQRQDEDEQKVRDRVANCINRGYLDHHHTYRPASAFGGWHDEADVLSGEITEAGRDLLAERRQLP